MLSIPRRRTRLYLLGIVILLAGLSVGSLLYRHSPQEDPDDDDAMLLAQSQKAYDLAVQRNVGAVGLLTSRWSEPLAQARLKIAVNV